MYAVISDVGLKATQSHFRIYSLMIDFILDMGTLLYLNGP